MTFIPKVDAVIQHGLRTYGGSVYVKGDFLVIKISSDAFHANLKDKSRLGKVYLYHQNKGRNLDGKRYSHLQMVCHNLDYAIYQAFVHNFNKTLGIKPTKQDWWRFEADARKFYDPWCDWKELGASFFY